MIKLATAANMQNIDKRTINEKGVPGLLLMERAAITVAEEIMKDFSEGSRGLAVVEGGNNGGDGLAVARILINAGYNVDIWHIGAISHETDCFRQNKQILNKMDAKFIDFNLLEIIETDDEINCMPYDFIVEGIFGVGLTRDVTAPHNKIIRLLNEISAKRYSIDIPAGINADTGKVMGEAFRADKTITFGFNKPGMVLFPGAGYAGQVVVRDIGFDRQVVLEEPINYFSYNISDLDKLPERIPDAHKGSYGRLAVIAGSEQMAGAAVLSASAAYRMGTGMVKVYTHEKNRNIICNDLPESLIMTYDSEYSAAECVKDAAAFADTILVGPGLSKDNMAHAIIEELIKIKPGTVIADADALNIMAERNIPPENIGAKVIITPHLKEMSRLEGISVKEISEDMPKTAKAYASEHKLVCVLKSARTCVASGICKALPEQSVYINSSGNDGMAVAGSGDVLAGIISGLVTTGAKADIAAMLGVYIHGLAGDMAADSLGRRSMLAGDIISHISEVLEA